jgi:hypothetical protein
MLSHLRVSAWVCTVSLAPPSSPSMTRSIGCVQHPNQRPFRGEASTGGRESRRHLLPAAANGGPQGRPRSGPGLRAVPQGGEAPPSFLCVGVILVALASSKLIDEMCCAVGRGSYFLRVSVISRVLASSKLIDEMCCVVFVFISALQRGKWAIGIHTGNTSKSATTKSAV